MTVAANYAPVAYNGDDSTDEFPFNWLINEDSDIVVTEVVLATGVETVKTLTTHYTVTGEGTGSGTVTAVTAPSALVKWVISRRIPRTQAVNYVNNDSFPAETHEGALDKLTMVTQEHDVSLARILRQPVGDTDDIDTLPTVADRSSMYLGFDDDGDPVAMAAPAGTTAVSVFMATVLDDTNAQDARTTLGASGLEVNDLEFKILGSNDTTKKIAFDVDIVSPATTRTWTFPDASDIFVGRATGETLTNKTLTSPVVTGLNLDGAVISRATQAEQETGTSVDRIVTPGRQHFHISACKAWAYVSGGGTPVVSGAYNVSGVTDHGDGDFSITLSTAFSTVNYVPIALCWDAGVGAFNRITVHEAARSGSATRFKVAANAETASDPQGFFCVFFGDL